MMLLKTRIFTRNVVLGNMLKQNPTRLLALVVVFYLEFCNSENIFKLFVAILHTYVCPKNSVFHSQFMFVLCLKRGKDINDIIIITIYIVVRVCLQKTPFWYEHTELIRHDDYNMFAK